MYFRGQPPPSVNMYWRRFAVKDIPLDNAEEFDFWLRERWYEKDAFMEEYIANGRFPASEEAISETQAAHNGYIETEVKLAHWWEIGGLLVTFAVFAFVVTLSSRVWSWIR